MSDNFKTVMAGTAQEKITPELPCKLAGYFHERVANRVRDDIFVKTLIINNLVLVSCDLATLTQEIVSGVKEIVRKECGFKPEQIIICATHTHTGPEIRKNVHPTWCDDGYINRLIKIIADTVIKAAAAKFEATVHYAATEVPGYSFNRLYRNADGSEVFGRSGDKIIGPAGPVDSSVQTLLIRDMDKEVRAFAVNFACHPDVIGGGKADFISADWPGEVAKNISAVYGKELICLFLQGTAGDINQNDYQKHYMPNGGILKAVQMGRGIAGAVMFAGEKAEPLDNVETDCRSENIKLPYYTRTREFMDKITELKQKTDRTYFENALIAKAENWDKDGKTVEAPVHCMRLGDVAIVGLPAEIFTALGLEIKKYSPAKYTMVIELCDKRITNYIPATDQANRGAYGSIPILSRFLEADAGRKIVECAIKNLHQLWS